MVMCVFSCFSVFNLTPGKYEAGFMVSKYGGGRPVDNGVNVDGMYVCWSCTQ